MMEYERAGDTLFLHMPGEVDHHSSEEIRRIVEKNLQESGIRRIVFDFAETTFMDSSGVGMLMGRYKRMRDRRGEVYISHAGYQIRRILRIAGMDRILAEWPSKEADRPGPPTEVCP